MIPFTVTIELKTKEEGDRLLSFLSDDNSAQEQLKDLLDKKEDIKRTMLDYTDTLRFIHAELAPYFNYRLNDPKFIREKIEKL